jgi:hypothetical protein
MSNKASDVSEKMMSHCLVYNYILNEDLICCINVFTIANFKVLYIKSTLRKWKEITVDSYHVYSSK